jgi:hypothetical protein
MCHNLMRLAIEEFYIVTYEVFAGLINNGFWIE